MYVWTELMIDAKSQIKFAPIRVEQVKWSPLHFQVERKGQVLPFSFLFRWS